ncbi:MAG: diguanylate cyclase/phosphodiesterase, partial [Porphyrobacter sp. HL-46]
MTENGPDNPLETAERDVIALGIAVAAIILLVATGGSVLPKALSALFGNGATPDVLLVNALLLNI